MPGKFHDHGIPFGSIIYFISIMPNFIKGSYSGGAPPLTIPNREVKPASADGTAYKWESRSLPDFIMSLCSSEHGLSFFGGNNNLYFIDVCFKTACK